MRPSRPNTIFYCNPSDTNSRAIMGRLSDHAIDFTLTTQWETLPANVQHQAKRCLLDTLGALIAGTQTPVAKIMRQTAMAQFSGDEATIVGTDQRVSAAGAALANGFSANALDIDDGYRNVKGHPGACALPPLLAASELTGGCQRQGIPHRFGGCLRIGHPCRGNPPRHLSLLPLLWKLGRHCRVGGCGQAVGTIPETTL